MSGNRKVQQCGDHEQADEPKFDEGAPLDAQCRVDEQRVVDGVQRNSADGDKGTQHCRGRHARCAEAPRRPNNKKRDSENYNSARDRPGNQRFLDRPPSGIPATLIRIIADPIRDVVVPAEEARQAHHQNDRGEHQPECSASAAPRLTGRE